MRYLVNCLISGAGGGLLSHLAAAFASRVENRNADLPMHAVSHIAWGDDPQSHTGRHPHNAVVGSALHHGACVFWAAFFEAFFGERAERSTAAALVGGATIATAAYVTDYHVVSERFKPGFEAHLSNRSLFTVYAALALGFAAAARLRGLRRHQIENHDKSDKRGYSQRGPDAVVTPE
jgi:hypothetical protein